MSTTLIVLVSILAIFAIVLILFMTTKNTQKKHDPTAHVNQGTKQQKKKKRQ